MSGRHPDDSDSYSESSSFGEEFTEDESSNRDHGQDDYDDDDKSYDLFGDEDASESEDIEESESNYSYEEVDPTANRVMSHRGNMEHFDDEGMSGSAHNMGRRPSNQGRGRMGRSASNRNNSQRHSTALVVAGGGSNHSRGHYSGNRSMSMGGSHHSRGSYHSRGHGSMHGSGYVGGYSPHDLRSQNGRQPPHHHSSNSYAWNDSGDQRSFSGPPGSVIVGDHQSMMMDDELTTAMYPGAASVDGGPTPTVYHGQGGFASRIRQKLPTFEPNQDTRKLCAFCICIFLFICGGVAVGAVYIGQGKVDVFEGVPDIGIGDDKEGVDEGGQESNVPTAFVNSTFAPTQMDQQITESPTAADAPSDVINTGLPTFAPTPPPIVFDQPTEIPTTSPTSAPTSFVLVVPDQVNVVPAADTTIRDDIPGDSFGDEDFLLIQNSDSINSYAIMAFDLAEVFDVTGASNIQSRRLGEQQQRQDEQEQPRERRLMLSDTPFEIKVLITMDQIVGIDPNRQPPPQMTISRIEAPTGDLESVDQGTFKRPTELGSVSFTLPGDIGRFNIEVTKLIALDSADPTQVDQQMVYFLVDSRGDGNNEMGVLLRSREFQSGALAPQLAFTFEAKPTEPPAEVQPAVPTASPTQLPTAPVQTSQPTVAPVQTSDPTPSPVTFSPTSSPTTKEPTIELTARPVSFGIQTPEPSAEDIATEAPTAMPTRIPTEMPVPVLTARPVSFGFGTPAPSLVQTRDDDLDPNDGQSSPISQAPTLTPTFMPTLIPTIVTASPTVGDTSEPTEASQAPTAGPRLTAAPFSFGIETPEPTSPQLRRRQLQRHLTRAEDETNEDSITTGEIIVYDMPPPCLTLGMMVTLEPTNSVPDDDDDDDVNIGDDSDGASDGGGDGGNVQDTEDGGN